jgi:hypothetical protein
MNRSDSALLWLRLNTPNVFKEFKWTTVYAALININKAQATWCKINHKLEAIEETLCIDFLYHGFSIELKKNGRGLLYDPINEKNKSYAVLAPKYIEKIVKELYNIRESEKPIVFH